MKDIERLFNRLNFGLFFPVWYIDCILRTYFAQVGIWIAKRSLSEEIFEKRNKNWEKSQNFMNDMQLYCNYNIIDVFVGFSVMAMMLVLWDVFQDVVEHNLLNMFSKRFIGIILFVTIFIVAYVPVYYFFHRHDKREKYFIEFDKEPMNQKWKWSAISIAVYVGIWAFVIILHHWYAK